MQQQRRLEVNGTMVWLIFALFITLLAVGCHGDTNQGGGTDQGHAGKQAAAPVQQRVPTPPTADQIDPSSPQAVLHGSSTTQTGAAPGTGAARSQPR